MKKFFLFLLLTALIFALAILCSSCENKFIYDIKDHPTVSAQPRPTPDGQEGVEVLPAQGGVLTLGISGFDTVNPLQTANEDMKIYMTLVFPGLVSLNNAQEPVGDIAVEWNTSDGGLTWSFLLRSGVKWHDGDPLTADSVKECFDWLMENESTYKPCVENISEVIVKDELNFDIVMESPDPFLPNRMYFPLVKDSWMPGKSFYSGSGMYKYSHSEGDVIYFTRFSDYHGQKPYIDGVEIHIFESENEKKESNVDLFILRNSDVTKYAAKSGYKIYRYNDRSFSCMVTYFNHETVTDPEATPGVIQPSPSPDPMENIYVRKAVCAVLDNNAIMDACVSGSGIVADWPFFPGTYYWKMASRNFVEKGKAAAQNYLIQGGYEYVAGKMAWYTIEDIDKQKYPLTLTCILESSDIELYNAMLSLEMSLEDIGIRFDIIRYDDPEEYQEALIKGGYSFACRKLEMASWPFVSDVFHSKGDLNYFGYSNSEVDMLIEDIYSGVGSSQKEINDMVSSKMDSVREILEQDIPIMGLYIRSGAILANERIHGLDSSGLGGVYCWDLFADFANYYIETVAV